jgi:peptide/nickel transport system substrate-binding protein
MQSLTGANFMNRLYYRTMILLAAVMLSVTQLGPTVQAATPKDMFVMATSLDTFTTLDPGESFEIGPGEYFRNTYDRLVRVDMQDHTRFNGDLAESWTIAADRRTFTFRLRPDTRFHSGNPVTAEDVVWSIQRAVLLNKGPAEIFHAIGLKKDNVLQRVVKVDAATLTIQTDQQYAPTFVLSVLGTSSASILDKKLLLTHQQGGDFGSTWLKTHEAGSGAYKLTSWKAKDSLVLSRFDGYHMLPAMKRIVLRHVAEAASQRLLLEKGDIDAARNLNPDGLAALAKAGIATIQSVPQATLLYLSLNTKNPTLAKPEVQEAIKWLVDYDGIQSNLLKGNYKVHQTFVPSGFLGVLQSKPYRLNVGKAKTLLAKAGLPKGFSVTMNASSESPYNEIAQALQANFSQAGIKVKLISGSNKQNLAQYRARHHDIFLGEWAADYLDPHTNAQTFAWNPDNAESSRFKTLAWRNGWSIPGLTQETQAALIEPSAAERVHRYRRMQTELLAHSPFVVMFQKVVQVALRKGVSGFDIGPIYDLNSYAGIKKK